MLISAFWDIFGLNMANIHYITAILKHFSFHFAVAQFFGFSFTSHKYYALTVSKIAIYHSIDILLQ